MEKQIENILSQVADIVQQDREQRAEQEKNGKGFNLFDALRLKESEKVHSAFIAELLNPNGQHGFGDKFLRAFIKSVDCLNDWGFSADSAKIKTEHHIDPINKNHTQGGVIDILIQSQEKAIIIENKIYAPDQPKQLIRYRNYAQKLVKSKDNYRLIYLKLDGSEASYDSTKNQLYANKDYYTIGYSSEILEWLKVCESESSQNIMVGSAITQYIKTIKDLINQNMLPENSDKIIDIMSRPENISVVLAIQNHIGGWQYKIVEEYLISKLQEWSENNNLQFEEENLLSNPRKFGNGFYFYRKEWTKSAIWIYTDSKKWKDFYIDISSTDGRILRGLCGKHKLFDGEVNKNSPYGREYLDKYRDWTNETMVDIAEGKVAEYIIDRVKEILEKIDQLGVEMP